MAIMFVSMRWVVILLITFANYMSGKTQNHEGLSLLLSGLVKIRSNCSEQYGRRFKWYYDDELGCRKCPECNPGSQPSQECGNGIGKGTVCENCPLGTYSDEFGYSPCKPCVVVCDNAINYTDCTPIKDRKCGPCKPRHFKDMYGNCEYCGNYDPDIDPACSVTTSISLETTLPLSTTHKVFTNQSTKAITTTVQGTTEKPSTDATREMTSETHRTTHALTNSAATNHVTHTAPGSRRRDSHHIVVKSQVALLLSGVLFIAALVGVLVYFVRRRFKTLTKSQTRKDSLSSINSEKEYSIQDCSYVDDLKRSPRHITEDVHMDNRVERLADETLQSQRNDDTSVIENHDETATHSDSTLCKFVNEQKQQKSPSKTKRRSILNRSLSKESKPEERDPLLEDESDNSMVCKGLSQQGIEQKSSESETADVNNTASSRGAALVQTAMNDENRYHRRLPTDAKMKTNILSLKHGHERREQNEEAFQLAKGKPISDLLNDTGIRDTIIESLTMPPNRRTDDTPVKYHQDLAVLVVKDHNKSNMFKGPLDVLTYMDTSMSGERDLNRLMNFLEDIARFDIVDKMCAWISQNGGATTTFSKHDTSVEQ